MSGGWFVVIEQGLPDVRLGMSRGARMTGANSGKARAGSPPSGEQRLDVNAFRIDPDERTGLYRVPARPLVERLRREQLRARVAVLIGQSIERVRQAGIGIANGQQAAGAAQDDGRSDLALVGAGQVARLLQARSPG